MKLCIIDDNTSITGLFSKLAKMKGHECIVANDGKTGLSLLESNVYDVTVLDLSMPEFSGLDVIDALEKSGSIAKQKIAVLTASTLGDEEFNELKKRGVKACLRKPMQIHSLLSTLEEIAQS